ncbi:MAG: adenylate/guanylate cyclase domain-containing protein, partial [Actinomycetota bacterium]
ALERHDWDEAYATLSGADRQGSLGGEGLDLLSQAAYWSAHPEETVELLERAYGAYLQEGDRASAAMMAYRVAEQNGMRMAVPQAQGWAARAQRLAEENPEWPVHGWLQWMRGLMAWLEGDLEAAIGQYERCQEFGARTGDRDLEVISLHDKGHALCLLGRIAEGMTLLDEAMTAVVGGELTPHTAGYVYCGMIGACSKLGDYRRAGEWTDATLRWCERQSVPAFPGVCRVHSAELLRLRGSFAKAEEEARLACEELPRFNLYSGLGPANYEIGEIRRNVGDFLGAEAAYADAHRFGFNPQPGLSLLRLAQGKVDAASAGIRQAVDEAGGNQCLQVRLLAAQVQIALASEDLETAAAAVAALESIVPRYEAASLHALLDGARGALRLAQGDAAEALSNLRRAQETWRQIKSPQQVAELSLMLARAHRALGNEDASAMEARSARDAFERVGALSAAARAAELLGEVGPTGEPPERVTRSYMFTDIVKSTDLVGAIGDEAWEGLLAWHDQTLRSLFAAHEGEVAHHTGDGFFVAFETARSALACAVAVQRALAEHRRDHGFAPMVRIGVHTAEATRRGRDYSGGEVHKAARIAAAGEGGEILASDETVAGVDGGFSVSEPREIDLKGIPQPVRVARIEWRSRGTVSG